MSAQDQIYISVILPVYNSEKFVAESIRSILSQTHKNFELIIINDGSSDNSASVIKTFTDSRIRYIEQENAGLATTLNRGIELASYEIIARQDNDDVSEPKRFEKQLTFLSENEGIGLLGTWAAIINENGESTGRYHRHFTRSNELKFYLLFDNPFVHSSVMFLKSAWKKAGGYSAQKNVFEDFNLWTGISKHYQIANLPDLLLRYREVKTGMSGSSKNYNTIVSAKSAENIRAYSSFSDDELKAFTEKNCSEKVYRKMLGQIAFDFSSKENITTAELQAVINTQLFNFRRYHYNIIINSPEYGFFRKMLARIGRKLLILANTSS